MIKKIIFLIVVAIVAGSIFKMSNKENNTNTTSTNSNEVEITPISHASMVLTWDEKKIFTDPVGDAKLFAGLPDPDIILLTDIHGDHLDVDTLKAIVADKTFIIAPQAVVNEIASKIPKVGIRSLNNNESWGEQGFKIEAIPMYNLPEKADSFHTKGRGNGYVIEKEGTRVYISGDTSGIPEMRNLKDIDMAFVAMNLPYTMSVEEAAEAVLAFKPKKVYPYHYRTPEGFSDVAKFKALVNAKDSNIEVVQLNWYPK